MFNLEKMPKDLHKNSNPKYVGILFIASLAAVLPMILFGIYEGVDLPQHLQFATTFHQAVLAGDFYPNWAANENLGYGSLGTRFYPPISSFLLALMRVISGDWHSAVWMTFLIFSFAGGLGVYLWAKEFVPSSKAVWAGVIYIFAPYHLFEILNSSLFAEFAGASVIPFCFLFVNRVCRRGKIQDLIGLAVSYAVLILAHLPLTVIGSFSLFIYALAQLYKRRNWVSILQLSAGVAVGLAASSFYWLKVITEKQWLRIINFTPDKPYFDYNLHFLLILPRTEVDVLWFLNLSVITLLTLVIGAKIDLISNGFIKLNHKLTPIYLLFFFSVFMLTPLSKPVWAFMPFLSEVQFPWRWLVIPSVSGSILIAANLNFWKFSKQKSLLWSKAKRLIAFASVMLMFLTYSSIYYKFYYNALQQTAFNNWVDEKSKSLGFEWFWTIKTKKEVFNFSEKVITDGRENKIIDWLPAERRFTVEEGTETSARIATLFYPNWTATVNGSPVQITPDENGAILIPLSKKKSEVCLYFQEFPIIKTGQLVSATVWLMLILLCVWLFLKSKISRS